jgi:hypothetical protein
MWTCAGRGVVSSGGRRRAAQRQLLRLLLGCGQPPATPAYLSFLAVHSPQLHRDGIQLIALYYGVRRRSNRGLAYRGYPDMSSPRPDVSCLCLVVIPRSYLSAEH